jgi:DNA-directed RNA polymerase subunit M/transcription elongation factor TFIIS
MPQAMVLKDEKCPKCNGWMITEWARQDDQLVLVGAHCGQCGYHKQMGPKNYRIFCENNCVYWRW